MELIESVLSDKEQLKKITAKYSNKKLEEIYNKLELKEWQCLAIEIPDELFLSINEG